VIAVTAILVAYLLFSLHQWREPTWQGRRLKEWLPGFDGYFLTGQTADAVRKMGTPTLPFLIEMIDARDSRAQQSLVELADDIGVHWFEYVPAAQRHLRSLAAFRSLGPAAKPAVPQLIRSLRHEQTRRIAQIALGAIGSPSVGPLITALADSRPGVRAGAAAALGECVWPTRGAPGELREEREWAAIMAGVSTACPGLIRCLKDADPQVRAAAAATLGKFGLEPSAIVPALAEALNDRDPQVRRAAALALGFFREAAAPAVPALVRLIKDPDAKVSEGAAFAVRLIDPDNAERLGAR